MREFLLYVELTTVLALGIAFVILILAGRMTTGMWLCYLVWLAYVWVILPRRADTRERRERKDRT